MMLIVVSPPLLVMPRRRRYAHGTEATGQVSTAHVAFLPTAKMTAAPQRLACQMTLTLLQNEFLSKLSENFQLARCIFRCASWLAWVSDILRLKAIGKGSGDEKKATT